tara:strand:- start:1815 stop:2555 length:741 start_codon:yes stop_codon:yes gene_type:complete
MFIEWSDVLLPDLKDVKNAKNFVNNAMHLLASFVDSEVPKVSSWGNPIRGGAAQLRDCHDKISEIVHKMIDGDANLSQTRNGWVWYTAGAIALSAFFSWNRMEKAIDVCLLQARAENDKLQRGLHERELDLAKATSQPEPTLNSIERRDIGGEKKYEQMKTYVTAVDVFKIVTRIVSNVTEAVMFTVEEGELRRPKINSLREKLLDARQSWRVCREEAREKERMLRAKEIEAEELNDWGFAPVREG